MISICGTVQGITGTGVLVTIERKGACQGCESQNICHGFVKKRMDLTLPLPSLEVHTGDTVLVAMDDSKLVKASATAFLIPLLFVLSGLFIARSLTPDFGVQALGAFLAFLASLVIVRYMGKKIESPHIVEVIHEK